MSDRTPEQVVTGPVGLAISRIFVAKGAHRGAEPFVVDLPSVIAAVIDALRAEGMLVEEGEVKVRLDGLEERLRQEFYDHGLDDDLTSAKYAANVAARVVRGETQEADRD